MTDDVVTADLVDDDFPVRVESSEVRFHGHVWDIRQDTFEYGGSSITREYVDHTGAVAILALDERDRVLLIKQYRHPIGARDWEIPAGLLDIDGESPVIGAQRELAEEADLVASDWGLLCDFATSPGGSNEVIRVYLARGLSATDSVFDRDEEEADIETRWVDLDDAVDAVLERSVGNAILSIALLAAHASRARGWANLGDADSPWPRHPKLRPRV
ncbi:MAG: ADP-ribose pyrophosphatase [Microbacteriaceae bacterium]|jgi:8-oxo-dGTP pyrophosphatase MutT (NUDIX family)|nr:ADP-ribose pyrophosphatase [Microbacteriaceae bacterium]